MSYLNNLDELIGKNKDGKLDQILLLRLSELAKGNTAVKVYSEILKCEVWLCSSARIALQLQSDDPEAITYTVAEMRQLIRLNPSAEGLKSIQNAKVAFPGSRVVDSKLKNQE